MNYELRIMEKKLVILNLFQDLFGRKIKSLYITLFTFHFQKGFTLVETILAVALLALIALGSVGTVILSTSGTQISGENFRATLLAEEGLEAVRSMRDDDPFNITLFTPGTNYGIDTSGSTATVSASPDTISDGAINFTRTINFSTISATESSVTSTVTWNETQTRSGSISLSTYLTNWKSLRGGLFVYGTTSVSNKTMVRTFDNVGNSFASAVQVLSETNNGNVVVRTSPVKNEAIVGVTSSAGSLSIYCYDGDSNTWRADLTGIALGSAAQKRFGIAYETHSGDVMVVYSRNTAANNALAYRTKPGNTGCGSSNWSGATNLPATGTGGTTLTTGTVDWVRAEGDPRSSSDRLAIAWNDSNSDLGSAVWNGNAWTNGFPAGALETNIEKSAAAGDMQSFDIAFETLSGNVIVAWGPDDASGGCSANCIGYARYTTSWATGTTINTADSATTIDLSASPNSNEMILGAIDNGTKAGNTDDLSIAYWSGTAWTANSNVDTTTADPPAGSKLVASGWLINGATKRSIVTYMDATGTGISWYVCNVATCAKQTDFSATPAMGDPKKWVDIQTDPFNSNDLVEVISDTNNDLWAKQLTMTSGAVFTWSDLEGGAALDTSLQQALASPMSFAFWRNL